MPAPFHLVRLTSAAMLAAVLAACGGGGGAGPEPAATATAPATATAATPAAPASPSTPVAAAALPPAVVSQWRLAQTHVLPPEGLRWAQPNGKTIELHLTGGRTALVLVDAEPATLASAQVEGRVGGASLGTVALADNAALPPTEAGGDRFSTTARVATLPAAWLQPGLELRVRADNTTPSAWQAVKVGALTSLTIRSLPFYLFGASESLVPLDTASRPSAKAMDELLAKWPIAHLEVPPHPAQRVDWPQIVVPPRNGNPAYVMAKAEDRLDGFDPIAVVHGVLGGLRTANGEGATANQYYGALVQAKGDGSFQGAGGGLGGGHVGAGDTTYSGIFVHEQGHAFGMPHAGESYSAGTGYPYPGGSLSGSAWGFDQVRQLFMSTLVPTNSPRFKNCSTHTYAGTPRQLDAQGRCIRQDPMQSGSGDQAMGDVYTLFADYNAGMVQKYLEGVASLDDKGQLTWDGGRVQESSASATGWRRWNSLTSTWVAVDPTVDGNKGLYGVNGGYPVARNVPVYSLVVTRSHAGTAGATHIYPAIGPYSGHLQRQFDPTSAADLAAVKPNTGPYPWYCHASGCDFTLRLTHADGSVRHVLLQGGFRPWFGPTSAPEASASNPLDGDSFRRFVVNVPADRPLAKVELLDTPQGWLGLPAQPAVLATRVLR